MTTAESLGRHRLGGRSDVARRALLQGLAPSLAFGVVAAILISFLLVLTPAVVLVAIVATLLAIRVIFHPSTAAYVLLFTTPLIVGIDRGSVLPLLRPSEALGLLLGGALLTRGFIRLGTGRQLSFRFSTVDASILLLALTSSVLPLLWMTARSKDVALDDLLYALTLWKYYGLYLLVRASVRTEREVRSCLALSLAAAALVAVVAILQSLQILGVPELLATYYAPFGDELALNINRGTSTLASSHATADVLTFNLAIALAWIARGPRSRLLLGSLTVLFVFGILASGQFSGVIALVVGAGAVGFLTGRLTRGVVASGPILVAAGLVLQPVLQERLNSVDPSRGLPTSWLGRLENLQRFFWPELTSNFNFLLGVRPSARVPAPESWREYVYIESGHTWLLWNGGIPFFLAFFVFLWTAMGALRRVAYQRSDAVGVAAIAAFAAAGVIGVLMTFDPHLTLRGAADLFFSLLALALLPVPKAERPDRSNDARNAFPAASHGTSSPAERFPVADGRSPVARPRHAPASSDPNVPCAGPSN